jgi:2-methylisocitrate lyase-like PEP mutase family enzyme
MTAAGCDLLRSLHVRGEPLLLPNAWDAASARAVEAAGFPAVATTSAGVAATLGHEDHEGAPAEEMLAAAARIGRALTVPLTIDAEAGYGMEPAELVVALKNAGAAGCNLEDSDHATRGLRDASSHAEWLRAVREAASAQDHELVINARIDVFLPHIGESGGGAQEAIVPEALRRAELYAEAGADCLYPIGLWEVGALERFVSAFPGAVNALSTPRSPSIAELAALGVARVSWGGQLHNESMERFRAVLQSLA